MRRYTALTRRLQRDFVDRWRHWISLLTASLLSLQPLSAAIKPDRSPEHITEILDGVKRHIPISNSIAVRIVKHDPLGVSVEPLNGRDGNFLISIDAGFLDLLDENDMAAAMAHELGHIWIFTHHPYLQTEALANEIAMRSVRRDTLKALYLKLWSFQGTSGNLSELLGPEPR